MNFQDASSIVPDFWRVTEQKARQHVSLRELTEDSVNKILQLALAELNVTLGKEIPETSPGMAPSTSLELAHSPFTIRTWSQPHTSAGQLGCHRETKGEKEPLLLIFLC